ncbi:MAG TPA: ABC transporter permease [Blastocatellia bacterium]|nr:ABC transporter permease [Blastocatellia bacterium]
MVIIRREYLTRVRTKAFVIGTILTPLLMMALITVPALLALRGGGERRVTVVDQSGDPGLFEAIKKRVVAPGPDAQLEDIANQPGPRTPPGARTKFVLTRVEVPADKSKEEIEREYNPAVEQDPENAYVVLWKGIQDGVEPVYYAKNVADFSIESLERTISAAVIERRLVQANVDPEKVNSYTRPLNMKKSKVGPEGASEEGELTAFLVPYMMLVFTYLTVFMYGIAVMRGVMEEKQSRIVEVLVSSVKPSQLMMGKLVGIGLVGLTQVTIWAGSVLLISAGFGALMAGKSASGPPRIPISLLIYFVLFFVLGYFLYATLYAVVGAIVSTEEEAQQAQAPVTILVMLPAVLFMVLLNNPSSGTAIALSLFPFFASTLMMMRIALVNPPFWQVLLSMLLMLATILGTVWVAGRIYRVGILMYGKRPSLAELGRWLRYT